MERIQMVDLKSQFLKIRKDVFAQMDEVFENTCFIRGDKVDRLQENLENYLGIKHVICCANGTDALQLALMALDLKPGDEVICPSFSFISSAEVIALLGLKPIFVDVDYNSFNTTARNIEQAISIKTKAIIPVHLFGQGAQMQAIKELAKQYSLFVIEDNAQSFGADYIFEDKHSKKLGTIGDIGCSSFYPTKNLACYGDGGAVFTDNDDLACKIRAIGNHGMKEKYRSERVGMNSRLDSLQAAVLNVKLQHLDEYISQRQQAASIYNNELADVKTIILPQTSRNCVHTFNQYTIKVKDGKRDGLRQYLSQNNIPSQIYYPRPLHRQEALMQISGQGTEMTTTDLLCSEVLSLPMHTELSEEQLLYICEKIRQYFKN